MQANVKDTKKIFTKNIETKTAFLKECFFQEVQMRIRPTHKPAMQLKRAKQIFSQMSDTSRNAS